MFFPVTRPEAREKFEKFWGVEKLPDKNGLMIPQMMEGLIDGKIRVFYIFGENLANTEPDIVKIKSPEGKITAGRGAGEGQCYA